MSAKVDKNNLFHQMSYGSWDVQSSKLSKIDISLLLSNDKAKLCRNGKIVDQIGNLLGYWVSSELRNNIVANSKIPNPSDVNVSIANQYLEAYEEYSKNIEERAKIVDQLFVYAAEICKINFARNEYILFVQQNKAVKNGEYLIVEIKLLDEVLHHSVSVTRTSEREIMGKVTLTPGMDQKSISRITDNMKKIVFVDEKKFDLFDLFDSSGDSRNKSWTISNIYSRIANLINDIAVQTANLKIEKRGKKIGDIVKINFSNKVTVLCSLKCNASNMSKFELFDQSSYPMINKHFEEIFI